MHKDGARPATWRPLSPPSLLSPPHLSSSPHQDTLVLVNSGFKRNAAFLWFFVGPVLKAGTCCLSVVLWSGKQASNGLLYSHTFQTSPAPASSPPSSLPPTFLALDSRHACPYHNESRLKYEKFLPLQATKFILPPPPCCHLTRFFSTMQCCWARGSFTPQSTLTHLFCNFVKS